jgi:hypothetical protein
MTTITATLSSELVRLGSYKPVPFHGIGSLTPFAPLLENQAEFFKSQPRLPSPWFTHVPCGSYRV